MPMSAGMSEEPTRVEPSLLVEPSSDSEECPEWLRDAMVPAPPSVACTCLVYKGVVEVVLLGVFPPEQLLNMSKQNVGLLTKDQKVIRTFQVRRRLRVGPLTVDIETWDPVTSTFECTQKEVLDLVQIRSNATVSQIHRERRLTLQRR